MSTITTENKNGYIFKIVITFLIPIIILLIPSGEVFTPQIKLFMAITLWGILMFVFEQVNTTVAALLMVFAYVIFNVAPLDVALKPWTAEITWITLACLFLVAIVLDTQIFERIGYEVLCKVGSSYMGIIFGVCITALACRLLMGSTAAVSTVALICLGLCHACGFGKSKEAAGIMLMGVIGYLDADLFLYSPDFFAVLQTNMTSIISDITVNYPIMLKHNIVFLPLLFVKAFVIAKMCGGDAKNIDKQVFRELKSALPPMPANEKKILVALIILIIYLFTNQFHGLPMIYGFILTPLILCLPGVNVGTAEHLAKTNYSFMFFFTGCQAIGAVGAAAGIGAFITATLVPHLVGMSAPVFTMAVWVFAFVANFGMTPAAEMGAFGAPLAQIVVDMGYNPYPTMYAFFNGVSNFILPYESAWPLFVYSLGLIPMKIFVKVYASKAILDFLWLITFGFLYWSFIGIL
ncbi:MAG: hypothetical protein GX800_10425 [Clostridiaceae bacterium]|nr:hypothetical protein [Clostridiaceae bacterium]